MQKWDLQTKQVELDSGQRAYIYQKLNEFEPFLLNDSTVKVDIEKVEKKSNQGNEPNNVEVTITLTAEGANVSASAKSTNIYDAANSAQVQLLDFLHNVQTEVLGVEETD